MASSFKCMPEQVMTAMVEWGSAGKGACHRSLETRIQSPKPMERKNGSHKVVLCHSHTHHQTHVYKNNKS